MMLPAQTDNLTRRTKRLCLGLSLALSLFTVACDQKAIKHDGDPDQRKQVTTNKDAAPAGIDRWLSFRHHSGHNAMMDEAVLKLKPDSLKSWDVTDGHNIKWKSEIALPGLSSPVIYGNHIYVSSATETKRVVEAYDLKSGKKIWSYDASDISNHIPVNIFKDDVGYAAATPCADEHGVYVIFTNGDMLALTHQGKRKWLKALGLPPIEYGYASSPVATGEHLIIQWDHEGDVADKPPYTQLASGVIALDTKDGSIKWHTKREWGPSWTSPVLSPDQKMVITTAGEYMTAHDMISGKEIWRAGGLVGELAPSPIITDKLAIGFSPDSEIWAYRLGGSGDITKTHRAWIGEDYAPNIASAALRETDTESTVVSLHATGHLTGVNTENGKLQFHEKLKETFTSSPVIIHNRIYLSSEEGNTHIYELADAKLRKLGQCNNLRAVKATMVPTSQGLLFRTVGMPGLLFMVRLQDS